MKIQYLKNLHIIQILVAYGYQDLVVTMDKKKAVFYSPLSENNEDLFSIDLESNTWIDESTKMFGGPIELSMILSGKESTEEVYVSYRDGMQSYLKRTGSAESSEWRTPEAPKNQPAEDPNLVLFNGQIIKANWNLEFLHNYLIHDNTFNGLIKEAEYRPSARSFLEERFVAMRNDSGGYALINKIRKVNVGPPDITTFIKDNRRIVIFLDFLNYLSFLEDTKYTGSTIILNDPSNINKCINYVRTHLSGCTNIDLFLPYYMDGRNLTLVLKKEIPIAQDRSIEYKDDGDYSNYYKRFYFVKMEKRNQAKN